jgi:hypothetical protein
MCNQKGNSQAKAETTDFTEFIGTQRAIWELWKRFAEWKQERCESDDNVPPMANCDQASCIHLVSAFQSIP